MKSARGFTLIEIMVTVVIIGILMAIAIPSYQEFLKKGRRADAQAYLAHVANKQAQYLLDARAYAVGGSALTDLSTPVPTSVSSFYAVAVAAGATVNPPSFVITAVPSGQQANDGTLTIDEKGTKQRVVSGSPKDW